MTAREGVIHIVAEELGVRASEVDTGRTFRDLGADSLDVVEIICSAEEEFGVDLEDFSPTTPDALISEVERLPKVW